MALRLSTGDAISTTSLYSSSSSTSTCIGDETINRLVQDASFSVEQKIQALKTLQIVIKNLLDPVKSQHVKYRTLKLDNVKLQERLLYIPYIQTDVLERQLGFVPSNSSSSTITDGGENNNEQEAILVVHQINVDATNQVQKAIMTSLQQLGDCDDDDVGNVMTSNNKNNNNSNKKLKLVVAGDNTKNNNDGTPVIVVGMEKLSEKQKARRLQEKQEQEKEDAKQERQRNLALFKQDCMVREMDPNWKPGLSAACAKSGSSISTFRDKYGES